MNERTGDYIAELTEKQTRIEELETQAIALNGRLLKKTTNMCDEDEQVGCVPIPAHHMYIL